METKRLYRNTTNRIIGGVASGLADYFSLDPLLVRMAFILFTILGGGALLIYIVLWIVTPDHPLADINPSKNPIHMEQQDPLKKQADGPRHKGNLIGGLVLITIGAIFLVDQFIPTIDFGDLWPVILIIIGVGLLINAYGRKEKKTD